MRVRSIGIVVFAFSLLAAACSDAGNPAHPESGDASSPMPSPTVAVGDDAGHDRASPPDAGSDAATTPADTGADAPARVGRFVAVGYDGRRAMSLDGRVWTHDTRDGAGDVDGPQLLRDVAYANGLFVAVGGGCAGGCKGRIAVTTDGISWTDVAPASANNWLGGVAWGNGTWIAVGGFPRVMRSIDGKTWTFADQSDGSLRKVRFANGWFVGVGDDGRRRRSKDGITWTSATSGGTGFGALAYGNGTWVVAGNGGRRVRSTDDGATWKDDVTSDSTDSVLFAEGRFVATSEGSLLTSPDGAAWTPHAGRSASGVGFGAPGGQARYVGFAWEAKRLASDDGLAWTVAVADDQASAFTTVAYGE